MIQGVAAKWSFSSLSAKKIHYNKIKCYNGFFIIIN